MKTSLFIYLRCFAFLLFGLFQGQLMAQSSFNTILPDGYVSYNIMTEGENAVMAYVCSPAGTNQTAIAWMRVDSNGKVLHKREMPLPNGEFGHTGYNGSLIRKANGNYVLLGSTNHFAFLLEVTPQFDSVRTGQYTHPSALGHNWFSLDLCSNGDIVVSGERVSLPPSDSIQQRAAFAARFDSTFTLLWDWVQAEPRTGPVDRYINKTGGRIIEMPDSSLIMTGSRVSRFYRDTTTNELYRFTKDGQMLWRKRIGSLNHEDGKSVILPQTDTTFYVLQSKGTGRFTKLGVNFGRKKLFLASYDLNGNMLWEKSYGNSLIRMGPQDLKGRDSTLILCLAYEDSTNLRAHSSIRALDLNGDSLWSVEGLSAVQAIPDVSVLYELDFTPSGAIVLAGRAHYVDSNNQYFQHIWMLRTDSAGCVESGCHSIGLLENSNSSTFSIYPNPANGQFEIDLKESNNFSKLQLEVFNSSGQGVLQQPLLQTRTSIATDAWPRGLYFVKIRSSAAQFSTAKLLVR